MNENNIVSIDTVIDRIKIDGYIDCNENDGYYDEYEYDNILYYLEKYKNLQSKIDKVNRILNANTHVENIYHSLCNLFDEEYQYEIDNDELNDILKVDK